MNSVKINEHCTDSCKIYALMYSVHINVQWTD